eukprot:scaffold85555_cov31-Tisochrysis_lutea.AAC.4
MRTLPATRRMRNLPELHEEACTCNCRAAALCTLTAVVARLMMVISARICSCAERIISSSCLLCTSPWTHGAWPAVKRTSCAQVHAAPTAAAAILAWGEISATSDDSCCLRCASSLRSSLNAAASACADTAAKEAEAGVGAVP